jgi:alginate O-acetyltransferase complex protein AlgI
VAAWSTVLLAGLLIPRERPSWELVGAAYYTLRNLHVLLDGWMERDRLPTLREMLRYQFFLPVLVVGPIHRLPNFRRALNQRRLNHTDLALGAERALLGLAQVTIVGTVLMQPVQRWAARGVEGFWEYWLLSAVEWVQLYFVFAGLSSFAVGASRMMGLTIEENFDRPFAARSLLDFWTRWHISLSRWCRDYVFQPVTAALRSPLAGLAAAMLAIGLWHETSAYYVLWGLWQVVGIVLNRVVLVQAERHGLVLPSWLGAILAPVLLLAWLSLARPVIQMLLGGVA